ncbi:MAG: MMPL family transporter [Pseudomonadales bacterium]|nr:MMPL family transporter [Pseudomonadales bacterium]
MVERYAQWVTTHKWFVLLTTLIMIAAMGMGGKNLEFSSNYRAFFSEGNPQLAAFDLLQTTYTKTDNVFVVLAPESGDAFDRNTLEAVQFLTEKAWLLPYTTRVDSLSNYQHTTSEEDDLYVADLLEEFPDIDDTELKRLRNIATNEPLLIHRLISTNGAVTAVNATMYLPEKTQEEVPEVVTATRAMLDELRAAYPDIDFYVTGTIMLNNAFFESSMNDLATLIPLMFVIIIITLGLLLRSIAGTISSVIVIFASIFTALGIFGWIGWSMSGPAAAAPTIIVTIAVADCVHVLVTFLHGMRSGLNKQAAMRESLRVNFQPILITTVTTIIGFLSMNSSDVPLFRDLGNLVAFGVATAWLFSIYTLPALMMVMPVRVKAETTQSKQSLSWLSEFVIGNRNKLLYGTLFVSMFALALVPNNKINDEFVKYFDNSIEFRQHTDFVEANLSGIYTIDYSLHTDLESGIANPQFLADVQALTLWLRQQPEVIHVNTITDIFKRLNKNMHSDDQSWYKLPEDRELAAQYLLLYEMSLPYGLDLNNQIDINKTATRLTVTLKNIRSEHTLALEKRIADWIETNTSIKEFYAASPNIMFSHIGYRNATSMISGTLLAMALITIVLIIALRSVKLGLMSMIPNMLPIGIAFGLWTFINGDIGLSLATSVGMALGIVVDDTVHFLSKYLRAKREQNLSNEDAVRYAFSTVGVALWVTSFVLVAGFLVLSLSSFGMNADRGLMASMAIALALIIDFLFLPTLLLGKSKETSHA